MKHWVFDLDGTLVDSLTSHFHVVSKVFNHFGKDFTSHHEQELLKITAKTLPDYFAEKLGFANTFESLAMFKSLNTESLKTIKVFDGIEPFLLALQKQGRKLAVWTARDREATEIILESTNLNRFFSICVSGTCVTNSKPHPEGLFKIAEHFNGSNKTMIMVGDFDSDMLGAQAFGCPAIRVNWHHSVPQPKCTIANQQFSKVSEMSHWALNSFFPK